MVHFGLAGGEPNLPENAWNVSGAEETQQRNVQSRFRREGGSHCALVSMRIGIWAGRILDSDLSCRGTITESLAGGTNLIRRATRAHWLTGASASSNEVSAASLRGTEPKATTANPRITIAHRSGRIENTNYLPAQGLNDAEYACQGRCYQNNAFVEK
jgi:hypothetical protein